MISLVPRAAEVRTHSVVPGLALCVGLGSLAFAAGDVGWVVDTVHAGPLLLVLLVGMAWQAAAGLPGGCAVGVNVAKKPILRWAVAGLGFRLSVGDVWRVSGPALAVLVVSTAAAVWVGLRLARRAGVSEKLGMLLSVGGAVCGASAVVATDTVVQAKENEAAYAVGVITIVGTVGTILYPLAHHLLGLSERLYSLWDGASLPEMAQVVAAGDSVSAAAAEHATVVKLVRICLLAPIVFSIACTLRAQRRAAGDPRVPLVPWFLIAFAGCVALTSTGWLDAGLLAWLQRADLWLLCVGMAGVGLHTNLRTLRAAGPRPLLVGAMQWLFLAALSLGLGAAALR
jgi:uncharacterized integral membrane protein (TIGR00698 family)